jgi:hypothetical protein
MIEETLVTINILSFNRRDELRNTLTKVYEQDYKNIEVIVVDNASSDGSAEMVKSEFPEVRLIRLEKNMGIGGWNEGFKVAKGEYVLMLDDDAYPEKKTILLSINEFEKDDTLACITFNLVDLNTNDFYSGNWLPKDKNRKRRWPIFVGCGFIVAKFRLPKTFHFPNNYFIYQHELPMAAEIYIAGKSIIFVPEIIAYHNFKDNNLYIQFKDAMIFRNTLRFIIDYIPLSIYIFYYLQIIVFYFARSIKYNWFQDYFKIIMNTKPFSIRKKISFEYLFLLTKNKIINFNVFSKIIKK